MNVSDCLYPLFRTEPLARTAEIFSPYIILFFGLLSILLWVSGDIKFIRLQPMLSHGWGPILKSVFRDLMSFPFGEMVVFTVIICYTTKFKYAGKVAMLGVAIAGALLSFSVAMQLMVLGVDSTARSNFPLLSAAREVSVAQFIERIDAFVVFIMMLGILIKSSVFMFAGLKGLEYVFRMPYRPFVFPITMVVSLFTVIIAFNFAEHVEEGLNYNVPYFIFPMAYVIPVILFVVTFIRLRKYKKPKGSES
ncbi:GerAB/ArcD/ProY family transporter [Ammoniphilus sp. 3BR4]|uniref:GerAB/ArcD/ProY family transporter n=1 Tax=Ammoniphilus sp. 3BR4 TaxID=3158265 RepID=UPI0034662F0C